MTDRRTTRIDRLFLGLVLLLLALWAVYPPQERPASQPALPAQTPGKV